MGLKQVKHAEYILNELKEISPLLAKIEKINVFTVPESYFSGLYKQVLEKHRMLSPLCCLPLTPVILPLKPIF